MRVSPVAWVAESESECLALARASAIVTHDAPEGIAGAQSVALAISLGGVPGELWTEAEALLSADLLDVHRTFSRRYRPSASS